MENLCFHIKRNEAKITPFTQREIFFASVSSLLIRSKTIGAPIETIGAPFETIGASFETIGAPCETIGAPFETIGASYLR
jgi:hypothetical protein